MNPAVWIPALYFGIALIVWIGYVAFQAIDIEPEGEDIAMGFIVGLLWAVLLPFALVFIIGLVTHNLARRGTRELV